MNKLITKIVGAALGLTMAAGVGVAAFLGSKSASQANASSPWIAHTGSLTAGNEYLIVAVGGNYSMNPANSSASGTTTTSQGGYSMESFVAANGPDRGFVFSDAGSGNFYIMDGSCYVYAGGTTNNGLGSRTSNTTNPSYGTWIVTETSTTGEYTIINTNGTGRQISAYGSTNWRSYGTTSGSKTNVLIYEKSSSSSPLLGVESAVNAKIGSNTISVTYQNFASAPTINASSDTTSVATVTSSATGSETSGSVTFTITGVSEGTATITFTATGASSVSTNVTVYEQQAFTKLFKTGKIVSGSKVVIAKNGSSTIMSNTQGSSANNRGTTTATPAGESDFSSLTTCNALAGVFTITAGTGTYDGYYSLYDTDNSGYLEWYSSKLTIYANLAAACYWKITIDSETGVATIANYSANSYSIKHNNGGLFSCYNTTTQNDIALYELSSDVPTDVSLSSITATGTPSVEVGSTITFTGSYLPTNATESIDVTVNTSYATCGSVMMANGTFTVEITGVAEISETSLSFGGADGHGSASVTLSVTSYAATHTKITSTSGLYNGVKVILGNYDTKKVGMAHTGGNNMSTTDGSFGDSGDTLSNASGTAFEYTMWYLTIADSDETDVSGWAFYGNGHYLTCGTSNNNHWKQTLQLSSLCLFDISFTSGTASIVAADSHVQRGTIALNDSIISAYASLGTYGAIDLYAKESSSATAMAAGYEDFHLMMDATLTEHGYCSSKGWYEHAKDAWNDSSFASSRQYVSAAGKARLAAWAAANGDSYDGGTGAITSGANRINIIGKDNTVLTATIIIITICVTTLGAYLILRKRKEQ